MRGARRNDNQIKSGQPAHSTGIGANSTVVLTVPTMI